MGTAYFIVNKDSVHWLCASQQTNGARGFNCMFTLFEKLRARARERETEGLLDYFVIGLVGDCAERYIDERGRQFFLRYYPRSFIGPVIESFFIPTQQQPSSSRYDLVYPLVNQSNDMTFSACLFLNIKQLLPSSVFIFRKCQSKFI